MHHEILVDLSSYFSIRGFREERESWKIIDISLPRVPCASSSVSERRSMPEKFYASSSE